MESVVGVAAIRRGAREGSPCRDDDIGVRTSGKWARGGWALPGGGRDQRGQRSRGRSKGAGLRSAHQGAGQRGTGGLGGEGGPCGRTLVFILREEP